MTPSEQIKAIRAKTGLSQVKFSAQFGVPKRTLEHWDLEPESHQIMYSNF